MPDSITSPLPRRSAPARTAPTTEPPVAAPTSRPPAAPPRRVPDGYVIPYEALQQKQARRFMDLALDHFAKMGRAEQDQLLAVLEARQSRRKGA